MPGKLCYGSTNNGYHPKLSKAYCEGRAAAAAGILVGENPHEASEAATAWSTGYATWVNDPSLGGPDCCDTAFGGGYTP